MTLHSPSVVGDTYLTSKSTQMEVDTVDKSQDGLIFLAKPPSGFCWQLRCQMLPSITRLTPYPDRQPWEAPSHHHPRLIMIVVQFPHWLGKRSPLSIHKSWLGKKPINSHQRELLGSDRQQLISSATSSNLHCVLY